MSSESFDSSFSTQPTLPVKIRPDDASLAEHAGSACSTRVLGIFIDVDSGFAFGVGYEDEGTFVGGGEECCGGGVLGDGAEVEERGDRLVGHVGDDIGLAVHGRDAEGAVSLERRKSLESLANEEGDRGSDGSDELQMVGIRPCCGRAIRNKNLRIVSGDVQLSRLARVRSVEESDVGGN